MTDEQDPAVAGHDPRTGTPPSSMRASDADRDAVADRLREAVQDGLLSLEELDGRLGAAFAARTQRDLVEITGDLPAAASVSATPLKLVTKSGAVERSGHWTVPSEIIVQCTSGAIKLDFTEASCPHREVNVHAEAKSGGIALIVPFGWTVDVNNVSAVSGSVADKTTGPPEPGAPILRVTGSVTSGALVARHRRRTLWQWLARVPRDPRRRR